jgi:uncharacterized membrane protein
MIGLTIAWVLVTIMACVIAVMVYGIRNLLRKNESLEDFIASQSEMIEQSRARLDEIDDKGFFRADDEIGWFFSQIKEIQDNLNNFRLR